MYSREKKRPIYVGNIRIGVNGGSLEKEILEKYGKLCSNAMIESARKHVGILEKLNFNDIITRNKL